jgi:hypothetical protein
VFDRGGNAQGFGELLLGELKLQGRCADERLQCRPLTGFPWNVKALVGKIGDPRSECESQEMAQRKDVIGEPGGVGVVLFDPQIGFAVEQVISSPVRDATHVLDGLGVKRCVFAAERQSVCGIAR